MKLNRRLLHQAQPARVDLGLTIALGVLAGIAIVGLARLLSQVVSQVFLEGGTLSQVLPLLTGFLALSLVWAALVWGREVTAGRLAGRVKRDLQERLAAHLFALGPAYTRGERSGELINTAVEGVEALDAYYRQYLPQLALAALVPLTILLFVFPLDWLSGLILLLTAPLIPLFMMLIGHAAEALTRRQWTSLSRMSAHFLDVLQGLTTLKLLGRSREQIRIISEISDRYRQTTMGVLRVTFLSALALEMVATLSTAVVAVQIGLRLLGGHLSFEEAFLILLLAPEFYLPLRMLGTRFHAGMAGMAAAQRIYEVLEVEPEVQSEAGTQVEAGPLLDLDLKLNLENIHYAYEAGQRPALRGLSFAVSPGQKVALVGPSGAGKSTVADLLLRFIEPDRGTITVGGRPLQDLSPQAWRQQVAWVPQSPHLFYGTMADNIRLGRPLASLDEVAWAARQAHADAFIEALPQGYDTIIGERGARLSGGEAQRIALARAFLKDAPLLILDEATANLDPAIEDLIQEAMARLWRNRTALIIAHRLSTVYRAGWILVMDDGRIVAEGTHEALSEQEGLYQRLVRAYSSGPYAAGALTAGGGGMRSTFGRLLSLAAPFAQRMTLAALLGFATIGSSIGLMTTSAYLISKAALQPSIADLQVAIVGVRFFGIARGIFRYLERYVSHDVTFRLLARLRVWFYGALEPLAPARLMRYRSGDLQARIVADIETLEQFYLRVIAPPVVAVLVALLAALIVGSFDPRLAVALLLFLLLGGAGVPLLTRSLSQPAGQRMVQVRSELNSSLVDGIQGMADLLAFGQEEPYLEQMRNLSGEFGGLQQRMTRVEGLHSALTGLLMNLAVLAVLVIAIPLVSSAELDGVYLALLVLAVMSTFEAVWPLPQASQYLDNSLQAARRLFEIVDAEPAVTDLPSPLPTPAAYGLQVQNLRFSYNRGAPPALDGVNFELPQGRCVAVVGPSGSGKTTLVHLLSRFWEYQEGHIVLAGRELREYGQEEVRRLITVLSQRPHLFNATVRENLLLAKPEASEAEMIQAAQQAQIHKFVAALPEGYDTWIGEQGLRLSGGEHQRLAMARAILKDAPILILDEPTANLDALTGREVMATLQNLMVRHTVLIITHRLVGLEAVDEVLVLRAGRIVERGRHHDLVQMDGLYRRMWDLQNQVL